MFCVNCGATLGDSAKFCNVCGATVQESQTSDAQSPTQFPQPFVAERKNERKTESVPKKEVSPFLKTFVSVICCVFIFLCSLSLLCVVSVRKTLSEDAIENTLERIDIEVVAENLDSFEEVIGGATPKQAEKIYRKTNIDRYVESKVTDYADYILTGSSPDEITAEEITELMTDNRYEIERIRSKELKEKDFNDIEDFFDDMDEDTIGVFSSKPSSGSIIGIARSVLSVLTIVGISVLLALFIFLMLYIRKADKASLIWLSIPTLLTSVIFGVFTLIKGIVLSFIPSAQKALLNILNAYFSSSFLTFLGYTFGALLLGVLLIFAYCVIKKFQNAKRVPH